MDFNTSKDPRNINRFHQTWTHALRNPKLPHLVKIEACLNFHCGSFFVTQQNIALLHTSIAVRHIKMAAGRRRKNLSAYMENVDISISNPNFPQSGNKLRFSWMTRAPKCVGASNKTRVKLHNCELFLDNGSGFRIW